MLHPEGRVSTGIRKGVQGSEGRGEPAGKESTSPFVLHQAPAQCGTRGDVRFAQCGTVVAGRVLPQLIHFSLVMSVSTQIDLDWKLNGCGFRAAFLLKKWGHSITNLILDRFMNEIIQ